MKNKFLSLACGALSAVTLFASAIGLTACSGGGAELLDENIIDDKYDNYYEIFVRSYRDSDGDGVGDFNGITEKLDYIRDMGYTGIWLMPIHESPSYHGYDVTDYKSVHSQYGTIEDYKNLVDAAHEKDIKVIIDLVVNHTSTSNPWFIKSSAYKNGQGGEAKYGDYYNWSVTKKDYYSQSGNLWYESRFSNTMPDLNLNSTAVRGEIEEIIKYWSEMGTDGFRLDGCCYYYDSQKESVDFCKWIKVGRHHHIRILRKRVRQLFQLPRGRVRRDCFGGPFALRKRFLGFDGQPQGQFAGRHTRSVFEQS